MAVVDGGANGSGKSLRMSGTISNAVPYAWAGSMWSPGTQMMSPANLSSKKEVRFWARGDGATYKLFLFAQASGMTPLSQDFVAGPEWREIVIPWSAFNTASADAAELRAVTKRYGAVTTQRGLDLRLELQVRMSDSQRTAI